MANLARETKIAKDLLAIRESVRRLYGARYLEELKPFREVLRGLHKENGLPYLTVGQEIAEEMSARGISPLMVMAATVELISPSGEVANDR